MSKLIEANQKLMYANTLIDQSFQCRVRMYQYLKDTKGDSQMALKILFRDTCSKWNTIENEEQSDHTIINQLTQDHMSTTAYIRER